MKLKLYFPPLSIIPIILLFNCGLILNAWSQKKSQKEITTYKGDSILIKQKQKIIILTGKAFIKKGVQGLSADKIIWNQKTDIAEAFNNVKFLNREQGVVYRGGYLKFYLSKDRVFANKQPYIENKKKKTIIYADQFNAYTKSNIIKAKGNTRIFLNQGQTNEIIAYSVKADYYVNNNDLNLYQNSQIITGDRLLFAENIVLNQAKQLVKLQKKVKIFFTNQPLKHKQETTSDKEKNKRDYILTCEKSNIFLKSNDLECFDNVKVKHREKNQYVTSESLNYNNVTRELLLTDNVNYYEKKETNQYHSSSEWLLIKEQEELMIQSNNVYSYDVNTITKATNKSLNCDALYYYYGDSEKNIPPNSSLNDKKDLLECFNNVILQNVVEKSRVEANYFSYDTKKEYGIAQKNPLFINTSKNNELLVFSDEIELLNFKKNILFKKNVNILNVDRSIEQNQNTTTNSTITCKDAIYDYSQTQEDQSIFKCRHNVDIFFPNNNSHLYGELLTYFLESKYSRVDDNVSFSHQTNPTNITRGTALYAINYDQEKQFFLHQDVVVNEYLNNQPTKQINAELLKYNYQSNQSSLEALTNVDLYSIVDQSHLYADYFYYDDKSSSGYAKGSPVLKQEDINQAKDTLYYADYITLNNQIKKISLFSNIYMFQITNKKMTYRNGLPRTYKPLLNLNYLNCQSGSYHYQSTNLFECFKDFHSVNHHQHTDVYSDYLLYDIDRNYSYLKKNPYIERHLSTNHYRIFSSNMELDQNQKIVYFKDNVSMVQLNPNRSTNSYINCDFSNYSYATNNHQLECFTNVSLTSLAENMVLTAQYLLYKPDTKYSYISVNPLLKKIEKNKTTTIKSDIMERFEDKELMYAKGNVLIDNGKDKAKSNWAIYNTQTEEVKLYGSPKVLNKDGSSFNSEEITFDVLKNTMELGSEVSGNLLFDKK